MKEYIRKFLNVFGFIAGYGLNIVILIVCLAVGYKFFLKSFELGESFISDSQEKDYVEATLTIEDGTSLDQVTALLKEEEIISSTFMFKLENILKGNKEPYTGGEFTVNNEMDVSEINRTLRTVVVMADDVTITIREGWNIKEIATYLESNDIVTAEDFIETCNSDVFRYSFLNDIPERENKLEGYLFPDTYRVTENANSEEIIDKMLYRFEEQYDDECRTRANELGLSMDEVITIASIIEKEINREEERGKASSVIYNRLDTGMKLQMCSTIIYVLDKQKERLLDEDLNVKSPYNTYLNAGLPVGPIGNPGKACIMAALYPDESDLLYFVVKDEKTGEHVFTNDYNEFLRAKEIYNQRF